MSDYSEHAIHAWTKDSIRLIATPSTFSKSALHYVQEIGHFRTFPPYMTERENLDSFLIVYTMNGKGRLTYKDESYILLPNQLFFIDCKKHQKYLTYREETWEILWVHLNGSATRFYHELFTEKNDPVISLPSTTNIPAILKELIRIHQLKNVRTELVSSKLIVDLLTELLLATDRVEHTFETPSYISEIQQHLNSRFNEKISLDQLAIEYATSKFHLAKQFKQYTGFSPGEYLINTRINHAKELLKYTDMPVNEIAAKVGIENTSHFINLFRDRVEHTPLVYRKKWQYPK